MQYLLMIYADPKQPDTPALLDRYGEFSDDVQKRGLLRDSHQLQRADTATCVRVRDRETIASDGPYAETREQIGGYYLLDCRDLDEAIDCASRIPNAEDGVIEIRPVVEG